MVVNCVEELENKIREAAVKKSIRIEEFFSDFDKLRKGFVTKTQFFRVLYRDYGLVLSEEEENALANKFSGPTCNTVDYKYFCCVIKRGIENDQCTTQYKPNQNIRNEYWNSSMDARLREILSKIHRFYKARELEFPDLCSQFSTNGKITQTQFFRSFVKPSGFDEEDMILLLQRYHDPQDHTLLRYIDLHRDLMQFDGEEEKEVVRNDEQIRCEAPKEGNDLQSLLDRLSQAAYVRQFKTIDVFRPFDTLNKGFIHVSHFLSGLDQCFNKVLKLSEEETSRIFREFSRPQDGFIDYKSFCRIIDDAYLEPDLKQHPMKKIFVPPVGYFGRKTVMLSEEEEAEVAKVLEEVKKELKLYKPLCYFFKDFEKHVNSGYVTTNQFRRALSLAEIPISQTSFDLLCRKFAHSHPGCVSYIKFLEQVDAEVISRRQQSEKNKQKSSKKNSTSNKLPQNLDFDGNVLTFTCLMDKIRNHVVVNRIRVKEFFSDFDPLNSGRVTKEQFKRALFLVGTGSLKGTLNFNDSQLEMVADHFSTGNYNACCNENDDNNNNNNNNSWCKNINNKNNNNKNNNNNNNCAQQDREELKLSYNKHGDLLEDEQTKEPCHPSKDDVMWKVFVTELEEGYYREDLDKRPTLQLKPALAFLCSKDGTRDLGRMGEEEKKWFDGLMDRMASKILSSNIDMFSIFRNFDKFRHGHVSRLSFRQALGIGGLSLPDELGLCALESAFHDVDGVNYIRFLDEISKKRPMGREEEDWSADQLVPVNNANCGKRTEEGSDVESILFKMKVKLAQQNIRVLDWFRVFDKNRSGKVTRNNFRRGLDQCRFELNEGDVSIIEDYYQVAPNLVAYMPFCEELESVYVDANIGKTPMRPTKPFKVPKTYYSEEQMSVEDKEVLNSFLLIILKRCKELRPNLMEFLKDFDKVNKGSITCDQFKKVIIDLKLVTENCSQKQWDLLFKRFGVMIGKQLDVNYLEFQKWIVQNNGC